MKKITILLIILPALILLTALSANTTRDIGKEPRLNKTVIAGWIMLYTNIERVKKGLLPLEYDPVLSKAAEWQAEYCSEIRNLSHTSRKKGMETPKDRMENFGRRCGFCGENLTVKFAINSEGIRAYVKKDKKGTYYDYGNYTVYWRNEKQMAYAMVESWMNSKHHRDNILNPEYSWIGAGAAKGFFSKNKSYYGCQVFNGYGGLTPGRIKIKYSLSGLETEKGKIDGKESYLFTYKGNMEPVIFEITEKSELVKHNIIEKDNRFIFIKEQKSSSDLFAALYDKKNKMIYPVLFLK